MPLTLRAVSLNDVPLTQPISARFDLAGGTIGRADSNTMALPDPERHISRQQAQVAVSSDGYSIRNVGAANPIVVGKRSLLQGESAPLGGRDQVRIGGYLLEVLEEGDDATQVVRTLAPPPSRAPDAVSQDPRPRIGPTHKPSNVIGEFNAPLSDTNPFADLLGGTAPAPPAPTPPSPVPRPVQSQVPSIARLPDDFDPFAEPVRAPIESIDPHARGSGLFDDLVPSAPARSIDDLFGLNASDTRDSLAAFVSESPTPGPGAATPAQTVASTDPMAMFDGPSATSRTMPQGPTASNHVPELNAEFRPPRPQASLPAVASAPTEPPVTATAVPIDPARDRSRTADRPEESAAAFVAPSLAATSAARSSPMSTSISAAGLPPPVSNTPSLVPEGADADGLLAAFCRGAGIELDRSRGLDLATMEMIGAMLRGSVEGVMQLIAVRSATRQELHAQITVIRPRDNNPLKFSPDAEAALEQMLAPPIRGFLGGASAVVDAMNDLVGHAIGTMAGTRAALDGVLERFSPSELGARLERNSLLDSVLPMSRRAKLWDLYVQHYGAIHDEAQEDFHALFGKAFMAAYEEQLERLRGEKPPSFD